MIQNYKIKKISTVTLLLMAFTGLTLIPRQSHPNNVSASANAEASAPRDIVLVFDTSSSMAYETSGNPVTSDSGDDPSVCNANNTCQPMQAVKDEALEFVNLLDFSKDRVAIVTMTSQTPGASRDPVEVLPLTSDQAAVQAAIQNIKVFEPRICDGSGAPGECLHFVNGAFNKSICEIYELALSNPDSNVKASADPSSCPSSNIGGVLKLAQQALAGSGDPDSIRLDASWEVIALVGGPANASTSDVNHPYGYCPQNTWLFLWMPDPKPKFCRDATPGNERSASSPLVTYTNPLNLQQMDISLYDAEDYARDMADNLAAMKSGGGVKIHTIGFGVGVTSAANGTPAVTCTIQTTSGPRPCGEAEYLLMYISHEAGDTLATDINHGEYFYAPNSVTLGVILQLLANNSGFIQPTSTKTATATPTATATRTATATATATATRTATATATATSTPTLLTMSSKSYAAYDGWILESSETSGKGGSMNSAATTFTLGDDASDKQYRAILHFDTSSLPDNAVVTTMTLKIKQSGNVVGTSPFSFSSLHVDMRNLAFGGNSLELADFNFAAKKVKSAIFNQNSVDNWFSARFNTAGNLYVNRTGTTQLRLSFSVDDNNNNIADFIRFYSGNAAAGDRPKLLITYYMP
jgi:hypothetical protein